MKKSETTPVSKVILAKGYAASVEPELQSAGYITYRQAVERLGITMYKLRKMIYDNPELGKDDSQGKGLFNWKAYKESDDATRVSTYTNYGKALTKDLKDRGLTTVYSLKNSGAMNYQAVIHRLNKYPSLKVEVNGETFVSMRDFFNFAEYPMYPRGKTLRDIIEDFEEHSGVKVSDFCDSNRSIKNPNSNRAANGKIRTYMKVDVTDLSWDQKELVEVMTKTLIENLRK